MATLTFVYMDSTAVVGPLATVREPHSWDLCVLHAGRITAPRGWELVRHAGPLPAQPDEDDLVALADAVREGRDGVSSMSGSGFAQPANGFSDPNGGQVAAPGAAVGPAGATGQNGRSAARTSARAAGSQRLIVVQAGLIDA